LLVEDNPAHAEAIQRALLDADASVKVLLAGTLAAFHQAVAVSHPDLAIMDLNLPDGRAVEALTSPPQDAPFPVLIMTSYGNEQVAVEAMKAGALDYIVKSAETFAGMPRSVERAMREWSLLQERKRAEAERKNMETRLLQAQKMEALGQLAGGVAHDFNNLLTGISGFAQFALEQTPAGSPAREDLKEVLKLAKRAEALTRQLLTFSRRQALPPEVLNINRTFEEMMKTLGRLIGENIDLVFILATDLGNVNVDPGQLEQVLVNLALNARDAMPGGGKLTVKTANVFLNHDNPGVDLSLRPGEYVMLAISDTGCGMDENTRQHIFEPFFTSKLQGIGTGLGLSTVYGIVNQLKGVILVDSQPGQGTTFKIYLPRVVAAANEKTPTTAGKEPLLKGTILIVEDDAAVLQITQRAIEVCGYHVLTAASSSEADMMLAVDGENVDLILLDVVLPGGNGYILFESLREKYPQLRVLYMSGYIDNTTVNNDILARGLPFIKKPFTAEALTLKVLEVLGEKHHG
jgi:signal transduction histidine kinase